MTNENKTREDEAEELFQRNVETLLKDEELRKMEMKRCTAEAYIDLRRTALNLIASGGLDRFEEFDERLRLLYNHAWTDGYQKAKGCAEEKAQ